MCDILYVYLFNASLGREDPLKDQSVCVGSYTNSTLITLDKLSNRQQTLSVMNKSTNLHQLTDCELE